MGHLLQDPWDELFQGSTLVIARVAGRVPRAAASSAGVGGDDADERAEEVARGPGPSYIIEPARGERFWRLDVESEHGVPHARAGPEATVFCCDFSARAIDMVKQRAATLPERDRNRVVAFVCDATCESLLENVPPGSIDGRRWCSH